jgi:hypothetical protein
LATEVEAEEEVDWVAVLLDELTLVVELVLDAEEELVLVELEVEVLVEREEVELELLVLEVLLLEDELVLDAVYVLPLKVSTYVLMSVAAWSPGLENSPTANAISVVEPTPRAKS